MKCGTSITNFSYGDLLEAHNRLKIPIFGQLLRFPMSIFSRFDDPLTSSGVDPDAHPLLNVNRAETRSEPWTTCQDRSNHARPKRWRLGMPAMMSCCGARRTSL